MNIYRRQLAIACLIALTFSVVPMPTHAIDFLGTAASAFGLSASDSIQSTIGKVFGGILESFKNLLISGIKVLSATLNWTIGLRPDGGGAVIYGAWRIMRDLCNLAFIVVIILTAFGTVFNTFQFGWLKPYTIYNTKLIRGFILSAIFINFSLAIGQSIVAVSNYATGMMISILPLNVGEQIGQRLDAAAAAIGRAPAAAITEQQTSTQGAQQVLADSSATKEAQNKRWESVFLGLYLQCIRDQNSAADSVRVACLKSAGRRFPLPYPEVATGTQKLYSAGNGAPPAVTKAGGLWGVGGEFALASDLKNAQQIVAARPLNESTADLEKIPSTLYSIFLYLVLMLSFLVVIAFMLVRIPIVWLILAFSPFAWVSLALPGTTWWRDWWKQFMSWNLFSPMYLGVIYIGLYLLGQQGALLGHLSANGSPIDAQLGALLFYIMVGFVFIGGSAAVLKFSKDWGGSGAEALTNITNSLGIKGQYGAVGAVYRGTGLQTEIQAIGERVEQKRRDVSANIRGRFPGLTATNEEALSAARQRLGVRGAGAEVSKLQEKRIGAQKDILRTRDDASLKKILTGGNRDAALAAGEMLLAKGQLKAEDMKRMAGQYAKISPVAEREFKDRVSKSLDEKVREKKFENTGEIISSLELLSGGQREKFLKNLERNQPLVAADLADKFYTNPDGTKARASDILERNANNIDNDAWVKILERSDSGNKDRNLDLTKALEDQLAERTKKLSNYLEMVKRAKPDQQQTIAHIAAINEQMQRKKGKKGKNN